MAKCVCALKDKNDDCIYNGPEHRSFAEVIKYIRNKSKFDMLFLLKCPNEETENSEIVSKDEHI